MNNKSMYTYMLVGAVLIAGFAGYMISDSNSVEIDLSDDDNDYTLTANVVASDNVLNMEESNGETESK